MPGRPGRPAERLGAHALEQPRATTNPGFRKQPAYQAAFETCHWPPRLAGIPQLFSTSAIRGGLKTPCERNSSTTGASFSANLSSSTVTTSRSGAPPFPAHHSAAAPSALPSLTPRAFAIVSASLVRREQEGHVSAEPVELGDDQRRAHAAGAAGEGGDEPSR